MMNKSENMNENMIDKNASEEELVSEVVERENASDGIRKQQREDAYNAYVKKVTPTYNTPLHMVKAFAVGGAICVIGQMITNFCMNVRGMDQMTAGRWTSLILVLASAVLTGFNIYPSLAQFAGAGVLVPITGFANGISSAALEYKKEGQVFGLGAQIFSIGGPVILYGIFTSWVLGLIYWVVKLVGAV
ncbi:MAG: SpoVA/SpoVAEb family sporulation membrane protein [Clostridiales bacterium]|nr:SpoVA/SpoVAEb family sporulation membrane protein [Clostridiales bacterium]